MHYELPGGAVQLSKRMETTHENAADAIDVSNALCYIVLRDHTMEDGRQGTSVEYQSRIDPDEALSLLVQVLPHVNESILHGPNG